MGADIYLNSIYNKNHDLYYPKFKEAAAERDRLRNLGDDTEAEAMQKLVEEYYDKMNEVGYFRDSYNSTSLMWLLGLSWWQPDVPYECFVPTENGWKAIADEAYELLSDEDRENTIHGWGPVACQRMLDRIYASFEDGTFETNFNKKFGAEVVWQQDDLGKSEETPEAESEGWHQMFMSKYECLTSLLREAIELQEPLHCSV